LVLSAFSFFFLQRIQFVTLFPYTTLFRSRSGWATSAGWPAAASPVWWPTSPSGRFRSASSAAGCITSSPTTTSTSPTAPTRGGRSEEHTSELQSRENLVCRLLLEKKKKSK